MKSWTQGQQVTPKSIPSLLLVWMLGHPNTAAHLGQLAGGCSACPTRPPTGSGALQGQAEHGPETTNPPSHSAAAAIHSQQALFPLSEHFLGCCGSTQTVPFAGKMPPAKPSIKLRQTPSPERHTTTPYHPPATTPNAHLQPGGAGEGESSVFTQTSRALDTKEM